MLDETIQRLLTQASQHLRDGDDDAAIRICQGILDNYPDQPEALGMLGVLSGKSGDPEGAKRLLLRANELRPGNPRIANSLALALLKTGEPAGAERLLRGCLKRTPGFVPAWYTLALVREEQRDIHAAVSCYERIVTLDPGFVEGWSSLAQLRERLNQLQLAGEAADRALALDPSNFMARLTAAQIDARTGRHETARLRLQSLLDDGGLTPTNEAVVRSRLGDALDALGLAPDAFAEYVSANRLQTRISGTAYRIDEGPYSLGAVRRLAASVENLSTRSRDAPADTEDSPLFLLGFPRSGTTLLDRMLSAHPGVVSIEEQETLVDAHRDFVVAEDGLARLSEIDERSRSGYAAAYRRRVADAAGRGAPVILDKLPLHSIFLPVIATLFPAARIIMVVRDPRDVCLSCFMQRFELNTAMAHFLDLELTAEYYRSVMELALDSLERFPIRYRQVRYEDLVSGPEPILRDLLSFMDLDWDGRVLDYLSRVPGSHIDTPSYRQVSRPLYQTSVGRWRRYAEQLAPVMEILAPLVTRLGYE